MALPPLVFYKTAAEYRTHFENLYCRGVITTFDNIRVYFSADKFGHAFYESSDVGGHKSVFSPVRAQRIDWIKATLEHPQASLYQGWDKKKKQHIGTRRIAVVYENFTVVIALRLKKQILKANFITCYQADNSIRTIRSSPTWSHADCLKELMRTVKGGL